MLFWGVALPMRHELVGRSNLVPQGLDGPVNCLHCLRSTFLKKEKGVRYGKKA